MKKTYERFDRTKLTLKPLDQRIHDLKIEDFYTLDSNIPEFKNEQLDNLSKIIKEVKSERKKVIIAMGAHVIRDGVSCYLIDLMKRGIVDHIAFNGACAIHDYELALIGATTESVARYIKTGEFGMWKETGYINDYIKEGLKSDYGFGQAMGHAIMQNNLKFKERSILYNAYQLEIPVTVHASIGYDIIHQHPNCDGAALGESTYIDFLVFAKTVEQLDGGVYMSFGTAVMGPEVFLKALSMARNKANKGNPDEYDIKLKNITTAVFDLLPIGEDEYRKQPQKSDSRYYFRPWKTILVRTLAESGQSFYIQGRHNVTVPNLYRLLT
ncbi:MAG: hypothetical protein JXB50_15020 [Spirochaetes bacterium]|nr:hypothetical protein [Spirochaetota bacterium]